MANYIEAYFHNIFQANKAFHNISKGVNGQLHKVHFIIVSRQRKPFIERCSVRLQVISQPPIQHLWALLKHSTATVSCILLLGRWGKEGEGGGWSRTEHAISGGSGEILLTTPNNRFLISSAFHFDLTIIPGMLHSSAEEDFMQVLGRVTWTRLRYHKWCCSNLFFWKDKFLFVILQQKNKRL